MKPRARSLRRTLLLGILLPVFAYVLFNTSVLYRQALAAADTAYDRTLLATAKSLSEQLQVQGSGDDVSVQATLLYSALEAFEADNRSRLYYRVLGFKGEMVSGFEDMPEPRKTVPVNSIYAALVNFYDDEYRGVPVRMAVLLQPVAGVQGQGMAVIQVAETLELRQTLARQILIDTLWRQAAMLAVIAFVVVLVVQLATRPVRELSQSLVQRREDDLSPLPTDEAPRELIPLLDATNQHMQRLSHLLNHQKRFVRDTSHQLRTPLAVLKTQLQSARRGDVEPHQALEEISHTVERATELANQMLALAKVEQMRQHRDAPVSDWSQTVRAVSLDLSALIADRNLDFLLDLPGHTPVRAHEWALREVTRNLLHNAIKHSPSGGTLQMSLHHQDGQAVLVVRDSGPGIAPALRERLFQPFATDHGAGPSLSGSGLGLTICLGIVQSIDGDISLDNRVLGDAVLGLDATVRLPIERST